MTNAFADEVAAARPRVTAVVARLVGDDAEDVVQEAVLRAFLSLSQLRDRDRFESWLCGIALSGAVERVAVTKLEAKTFYAEVTVDGQTLDARPSDAINLAVRTGAPVLVASTLLDEDGIESNAAEVDVPEDAEVPPGEWRSLTNDLLATLYSPPH